jgi:hypothetical protein
MASGKARLTLERPTASNRRAWRSKAAEGNLPWRAVLIQQAKRRAGQPPADSWWRICLTSRDWALLTGQERPRPPWERGRWS